MIKKIICLILLYLCLNCSNNNEISNNYEDNNSLSGPENLYNLAKISFDSQNFELASNQFSEIKRLYPLSNEAIQSEIMIAFIDYIWPASFDTPPLTYWQMMRVPHPVITE